MVRCVASSADRHSSNHSNPTSESVGEHALVLRFSPAFLGPSAAQVAAKASITLAVEVLVGALRTIRGVCLANRALCPQLSHDILQFIEHVCHSEQWDYNPGCGECFT
jgi:hypothetical protein